MIRTNAVGSAVPPNLSVILDRSLTLHAAKRFPITPGGGAPTARTKVRAAGFRLRLAGVRSHSHGAGLPSPPARFDLSLWYFSRSWPFKWVYYTADGDKSQPRKSTKMNFLRGGLSSLFLPPAARTEGGRNRRRRTGPDRRFFRKCTEIARRDVQYLCIPAEPMRKIHGNPELFPGKQAPKRTIRSVSALLNKECTFVKTGKSCRFFSFFYNFHENLRFVY